MKKILLTTVLSAFSYFGFSQIIFTVENPASIAGSYSFENSTGWGQLPDMSIPANAIQSEIVIARDSLLCGAATNANQLAGKVAVIYRGTCEFGLKVLKAQEAGAIAAIVVNNAAGAAIPMGAGADGANVTIPSLMISDVDGALITDKVRAGETVEIFFGNKIGFYVNDLGMANADFLISRYQAIPQLIAQNGSEFSIEMGAWVRNYGSASQSNVQLNAKVTGGGSTYNETSAGVTLASGDSIWVALPLFSMNSYALGQYTITYSISGGVADDYMQDNIFTSQFNITDGMLTIARLDANGMPTIDTGFKPQTVGAFTTCFPFINSNASRLGVEGIYFGAMTGSSSGEEVTNAEMLLIAYQWDDQFATLGEAAMSSISEVGSVSYIFTEDLQEQMIYAKFDYPFVMLDNQKYLFCQSTQNTSLYLPYDTKTKYDLVEALPGQQTHISYINTDTGWGTGFADNNDHPSIGVKTFPANEMSVENKTIETSVYPNPTKDFITVKLANVIGAGNLVVSDLSGKVVLNQNIDVNGGVLKLNVNSLTNGMYVFNLSMNDGSKSTFKVSVNK